MADTKSHGESSRHPGAHINSPAPPSGPCHHLAGTDSTWRPFLSCQSISTMTSPSYSCLLAPATSTAQQNPASSPSKDDAQADIRGLRDCAVRAAGRAGKTKLSSILSLRVFFCVWRLPHWACDVCHLVQSLFLKRSWFFSLGVRGLSYWGARWTWVWDVPLCLSKGCPP